MPSEQEKWLGFTQIRQQYKVPYVIYADFEALLQKVYSCSPDPSTSNTEVLQKHVACGYCYVVVGPDGNSIGKPTVYRGEDAVVHFLNSLIKEEEAILTVLRNKKPIVMSAEDKAHFQRAESCLICHKELGSDRVRDHDHLTGKYRGALHSNCNLNYQLPNRIPVIFHNLRGYDSHFIVRELGKFPGRRITCIPNNKEKYISISLSNLVFLDSMQFLPSSLAKLVENLPRDKFTIVRNHIRQSRLFELLLRKGVYPYEYMDSFDRFAEEELPEQDAFFSRLTEERVSEEEYSHARQVWEEAGCQNLGDYHDLYVMSDTLQLADVFQDFRRLCCDFYGIDPCHNYTAPGLAWQAALKMTGVKLELFTDPTMHLFVERGIRGGMSTISHRYARANHPNMSGEYQYDSSLPPHYLVYLDANNLYGWAMSQSLPIDGFRWCENVDLQTVLDTSDDSEVGYIVEVDLIYPENLHQLHNDYPLAPEKMRITTDMLSPTQVEMSERLGVKLGGKHEKLVANLLPKNRYVVHYRNLKQYVRLGLVVSKLSKVLAFRQQPWLRKYVEFNTVQRQKAANGFEKDFFKLMNNAVFGKTMENLRNRVKVELVTDKKRAKKLVASPAYDTSKILTEGLVVVQSKITSLTLNRPVYAGFTILDVSKTLMYDFHYGHIVAKYGEKSKLLFTDTDSLAYVIETSNVYDDMLENIDLYDTSEYPSNHILHSLTNKKVLGKMKDELAGCVGLEFVGLRSKMYSLRSTQADKLTAKGVSKAVIKRRLKHEHYRSSLLDIQRTRETNVRITSRDHLLTTTASRKVALCPLDDKRYILPDGVSTLAFGHFGIPQSRPREPRPHVPP